MKNFMRAKMTALIMMTFGVVSAAPTVVHITDGADIKADFVLADTPTVSYTPNGLSIVAGDMKVVYPADATYTFSLSESSGIADVVSDECIDLSQNYGEIHISGLSAGASVSVYDIDGRVLALVEADANGVAYINLESHSGIVLVSTPTKTFKLILKH